MKRNTIGLWPLLMLLLGVAWTDRAFAYYDPGVQRWINRDPIDESGGINVYRFVHNDPENFVDPDGQAAATFPIRIPIPIIRPFPIAVPGPWLLCAITKDPILKSCNPTERKACAAQCGGYKYIFMCTVRHGGIMICHCRTVPHPGDPHPQPPSWP